MNPLYDRSQDHLVPSPERQARLDAAAERSRTEREERRIEHAKFDGPGWGVLTSAGPWGRVCVVLDEAKDLALAATELYLTPVTVVKVRENENMLDHYMGTFESRDPMDYLHDSADFERETSR